MNNFDILHGPYFYCLLFTVHWSLFDCMLHVVQNSELYEDQEELANIIKQAAMERLKLEQQLSEAVSAHFYFTWTARFNVHPHHYNLLYYSSCNIEKLLKLHVFYLVCFDQAAIHMVGPSVHPFVDQSVGQSLYTISISAR